jgi:hypothetical protein
MKSVWVVVEFVGESEIEIQGVYSEKERAYKAILNKNMHAVRFRLDEDYSRVYTFSVMTFGNPTPTYVTCDPAKVDATEDRS